MSRPVLPWRSILLAKPPGNAQVWIRRLPFYDRPVKAQARPEDELFAVTWQFQSGESYEIGVGFAVVHSWKFQYKADEDAYRAANPGA